MGVYDPHRHWLKGPTLRQDSKTWPKSSNAEVSLLLAEGLSITEVHQEAKPLSTKLSPITNPDPEIQEIRQLQEAMFTDEIQGKKTGLARNLGDYKDHELDKADEGVLLMDPRELLEDTSLTQIIDNTPEHVASGTETDINNEVASSPQTKSSDQRRAAAVQAIERINRWTRELIVASPTRIRTVPVVGVPHHLEVELNGLGEDCVISIWRAKCPSVASPTRIRTVPVVGVPHHLEVELNGLGEDCVISIWRVKCPSVASPTRIRTVPVVGVPHHLEVELNGLGEDCVMSIWRAKCPSVANPTRIRTVPVVGVPHHLEVELNGLGEDCVMSIWRAKCPSVANPTRIRTVPVVGVPHHLEVE
ncbi:hypothetical protein ACJJTC_004388 [Scirpophaga incertulas]